MPQSAIRSFNGNKLREIRKARGLSLAELGRQARIHANLISNWERGVHHPSDQGLIDTLAVLQADLFSVLDTPRNRANLTELRVDNRFTRDDLAEELGVSRTAWTNIERGMNAPSADKMERLVEIFQLPASTPAQLRNSLNMIRDAWEITHDQYYGT